MRVPFRVPFFFPWIYPDLLWRVNTSEKNIYLTFDDGPVPGATEFVLQTLKAYEAQATFFCIGDNIRKHPSIFEYLKKSPHRLGNHTFNHLKAWRTSDEAYLQNILQCDELLGVYEKSSKKLFRPPYGQISKSKIKLLSPYKIIMWDVLTQDYNSGISAERCLRGTIQATRPGSIVVFHDSYKAERNMNYALPRFLDHFKNKGYSFHAIATQ